MSKANGTVETTGVVNRVEGVVSESKFKRLSRLLERIGENKACTVRRKTEEGTVTVTVKGRVCLTDADAAAQAAIEGCKAATRALAGFGEADGGNSATVKPEDSAGFISVLCGR